MSKGPGGMLQLDCLYNFVDEYRDRGDEAVRLKGSALGEEYCRRCGKIADAVPELSGFYIWGRYDSRRYWRSIYLGKAGYGRKKNKNNLRVRILEELKDERGFVWCHVYEQEEVTQICQRINEGKYSCKRALLKHGTTEIIWVPVLAPTLSDADILKVEADLIEAVNPKANLSRPTPMKDVQRVAGGVLSRFRKIIHENRPRNPIAVTSLG